MKHYIKSKILMRRARKIMKWITKATQGDDELALYNYEAADMEGLFEDIYNEMLLCPFYTLKAKQEMCDGLRKITNIFNEYRMRKGA